MYYLNQASAAFLSLYFFIFLSLQFSTLKFFVTFFSGTMRPRRLKLGTLVYSGQMYHVNRIQTAAAYSFLYFFIFLSLQFSNIKVFVTLLSETVRPRRLKLGTNVDSGLMYRLYRNQAYTGIIVRYKRIGYNINIMRQSACLVFNPITVNNFASLFNCTPVGRASDSVMAPT